MLTSTMYLQISNLLKSFSGQIVLGDVSFTIGKNEHVALLGGNGSGKSTLLKVIAGEEEADKGAVIISPKKAHIAYLPQVIKDPDLKNMSSGQRVRKCLYKLLSTNPEALLLDEPTNHLDWEGLDWLEKIVQSFSGPVLVVSHDRWFLDRTTDKTLVLEDGHVRVYGGNYSFYKQQKEVEEEAQSRSYKEQQKRLGRLAERAKVMKNRTQQLEVRTTGADHYVRKKAAKAASAALSIEKRIAKELSEAKMEKPKPDWELKPLFKPKNESSQTVVQVANAFKSFDGKRILEDVSLTIQSGQRVALIGENGSGKTTLIGLMVGELQPDSGVVRLGNNVSIGYLSQEHKELSGEEMVLDELAGGKIGRTEAYKLLHKFLLTPEKMGQEVKSLSSGEKGKLLLAKIMTKGDNFIILDEPTNHLDIPSREAIEDALASYEGTLLIVSHDRYFLERVGVTDFYVLNKGQLNKLN